MHIPRVVIAGTHSGVGKTTLATGIMAALTKRGRPIQGYKIGPDYIDPSYHALATGRPSRNLDRWLLGERLPQVFARSAKQKWAVIEGVMGLFDGMSGTRGFGSSADVAKLIQAPVILVVDAVNLSRSVAALVHGYMTFDPDFSLAGVILNRVKSSAQEKLLKEALTEIEVPVLGSVPKEEALKLPERHLGLVPSQERRFRDSFWEDLQRVITTYIDLNQIEALMKQVKPLAQSQSLSEKEQDYPKIKQGLQEEEIRAGHKVPKQLLWKPRLGVAWDEAFTFYYQDALEQAEESGFEIVPFSPLHDQGLPDDLDGIFFGGGFPELHLEALSANHSFLQSLTDFARSGKAIYAECGGYMYLGESITDFAGRRFSMAGLIPMEAEMTPRLQGMGYRTGVMRQESFLGPAGTEVHGHEFHYSRVQFDTKLDQGIKAAFKLFKGGEFVRMEGYADGQLFGSYLHLNFAGHPELLKSWRNRIQGKRYGEGAGR